MVVVSLEVEWDEKERVGKLYSIGKIVVFVCWRMIKLGDRGRSVSNSMNDDS